ncbi:MAG: mandelate racemase/muconate lactonizing enzyme family protein [Caldilineaceae bacterium]
MDRQIFGSKVVAVEWAMLEGQRPRHAGCNGRLGEHGLTVRVPVARLTLDDGSSGFGHSRGTAQEAQRVVGHSLVELFLPGQGSTALGRPLDFPLWDLVGKLVGQPVYGVAAGFVGKSAPAALRVPCYDTSLYFDDLHLADQEEAVVLLAAEAQQGYTRGHRHFKIKVGRGARHLPLEAGTQRDIAIIHAVRAVAGPAGKLMIDANNGYNLNLTKRVLKETAAANVFWMEEAFHEDPVLYRDLKAWLQAEGIATLIADGEGWAAPPLLDWAREGLVEVVQYDIHSHSFTQWLALGQQLDAWGVRSAPHHYGGHIGNYTAPHLAAAVTGFTFAEWDEASTPGIGATGYVVEEGQVNVPATAGFGMTLDEDRFRRAVTDNGYAVRG